MSIKTYSSFPCEYLSVITIDTDANTVETTYKGINQSLVYTVVDATNFEKLLLAESEKDDFELLPFLTTLIKSGDMNLVDPKKENADAYELINSIETETEVEVPTDTFNR